MKYRRQPKEHRASPASLPRLSNPLSSETSRGANVGMSQLRSVEEQQAHWRLARNGYRLHSGAVFFVVNDDPEDFRESLVANWDGSAVEAWRNLEAHGFPTSPFILCQTCGSGEAEFGGECQTCNQETIQWVKAGE